MAKAKKTAARKPAAPKNTATVSYLDGYGDERVHSFATPFRKHGIAEEILNEAERHGCKDIAALRAQLVKHYPA